MDWIIPHSELPTFSTSKMVIGELGSRFSAEGPI